MGDIPSHPFLLHKQSCPCPSTISSAYLFTTPSATSDAISTEISLPSTSLRFTPTASSRPHSAHCTRSLPWHVHPRLAHSTSLTRSGLGVQSVSSWNVASRRSSWSRSPGQYLSSDVAPLDEGGAGLPEGVHFRSVTFDIVVVVCGPLDGDEAATSPYLDGVDGGPATRRFLPRYSRSLVPILMVDAGDEKMEGVWAGGDSGPRRARVLAVGGSRPVLCVVEGWSSTAVAESEAGRLGVSPLLMPWRRALNLRLTVEFMLLTSAPWGGGIMGVIGSVISGGWGEGGGMDGSVGCDGCRGCVCLVGGSAAATLGGCCRCLGLLGASQDFGERIDGQREDGISNGRWRIGYRMELIEVGLDASRLVRREIEECQEAVFWWSGQQRER